MEDPKNPAEQNKIEFDIPEERIPDIRNLIGSITSGQTRREVESILDIRDGGLQESSRTRYFVSPDIMIEVPFDTTGGPWSPENKVKGNLKVYQGNLHLD